MQVCKGRENRRSIQSKTLASFQLLLLRILFLVVFMDLEQQNFKTATTRNKQTTITKKSMTNST
jgi:hypothetical protein